MTDLHAEINAICTKLKAGHRDSVANALERRMSGGATSTEILMSVSAELTRAAFKEKGISWRLRKDMIVLSWRIDGAVRV